MAPDSPRRYQSSYSFSTPCSPQETVGPSLTQGRAFLRCCCGPGLDKCVLNECHSPEASTPPSHAPPTPPAAASADSLPCLLPPARGPRAPRRRSTLLSGAPTGLRMPPPPLTRGDPVPLSSDSTLLEIKLFVGEPPPGGEGAATIRIPRGVKQVPPWREVARTRQRAFCRHPSGASETSGTHRATSGQDKRQANC